MFCRRRHQLGRKTDEARPLRRRPRGPGNAPGSDRPLLPLESDRRQARRDRLDHRRSRRRPARAASSATLSTASSPSPPSRTGTATRYRPMARTLPSRCTASIARPRPPRRLDDDCGKAHRSSCRSASPSCSHKLGLKLGRFDARRYKQRCRRQLRFPQVRRRAEDDRSTSTPSIWSGSRRCWKRHEPRASAATACIGQASALMTCFVPTPIVA